MTAKTNILVSLLKLAKNGPVAKEDLATDANVPIHFVNDFLKGLLEFGLVRCENGKVELSSNQRVKLAIHAINYGSDIERICKVLEWKDFENFSATAFETNKFAVKRRFHFKASERRYEIDVLAYSQPIIVCVDCKHWLRGWRNSAIKKVVAAQEERTKVLAKVLPLIKRRVGLDGWKQAILLPVIISLFPGPVKFYNKVPVVPILQLQNFLDEFQGHISELTHFQSKFGPMLSDYINRIL